MRLRQLARKYDIPVQEIISYLEDTASINETIHPNFKLDEEASALVADHFDLSLDTFKEEPEEPTALKKELIKEEEAEEETEVQQEVEVTEDIEPAPMRQIEPETPLEDIAMAEGEIELMPGDEKSLVEEQVPAEPPIEEKLVPKEDEVIETDRLLELLETEETPKDLEKIKLIKAPKKELSGLKVLGKIEVPEPKKKEEEKSEPEVRKPKFSPEELRQRQQAREEQREKRRQLAKKKKEEHEARQEKRRKEREKREQKAKRAAHYQQKLAKAKASQPKHEPPTQPTAPKTETPPEPKTFFARFWRWFTTGSDW